MAGLIGWAWVKWTGWFYEKHNSWILPPFRLLLANDWRRGLKKFYMTFYDDDRFWLFFKWPFLFVLLAPKGGYPWNLFPLLTIACCCYFVENIFSLFLEFCHLTFLFAFYEQHFETFPLVVTLPTIFRRCTSQSD